MLVTYRQLLGYQHDSGDGSHQQLENQTTRPRLVHEVIQNPWMQRFGWTYRCDYCKLPVPCVRNESADYACNIQSPQIVVRAHQDLVDVKASFKMADTFGPIVPFFL